MRHLILEACGYSSATPSIVSKLVESKVQFSACFPLDFRNSIWTLPLYRIQTVSTTDETSTCSIGTWKSRRAFLGYGMRHRARLLAGDGHPRRGRQFLQEGPLRSESLILATALV
eukprot:343622-Amphidinium_carterae.1